MESLALIRSQGKQYLVGYGPFESHAEAPRGEVFFYVQDFLLSDAKPFKIPSSWSYCEAAELRERLPAQQSVQVSWEPVDEAPYLKAFHQAQARFRDQSWSKAVPVIVERGQARAGLKAGDWMSALWDAPDSLVPYAFFENGRGFVGATPEWLFRREGAGPLETMALAGSTTLEAAAGLLKDPKLLREHALVADDLRSRLAQWGRVEADTLEIARLPSLAHARTRLRCFEAQPADFGSWVERLHPTPALGIAPRSAQTPASLQLLDAYGARGVLGAPFGASFPGGELCVVALRNLQIEGDRVYLVAGAGILAESRLDLELAELALKRRSVKAYWQL